MIWFLYFSVVWVSASVVILATGWYVSTILKVYCPGWWRRVVVDFDPYVEAK
jgi:hypothetical protein